jgi:Peptidase family M23/Putative peptidoglycan binding domain
MLVFSDSYSKVKLQCLRNTRWVAMRFPFDFVPSESWHVSPRRFGAARAGGRKHAGCDLYAPVGTPVFAISYGTVKSFSAFYKGTFALTIDHGEFLVRYGEVSEKIASNFSVGAKVKEGDQIAHVGDLIGLNLSMLHLEVYGGTASGPLTSPGRLPYKRRADLIDPTGLMDEWAKLGDSHVLLRFGSEGDAVLEWQQRLLSQGYAMSLDGSFGLSTETATVDFQREANLVADGIVGPDTYVAMVEAEKD